MLALPLSAARRGLLPGLLLALAVPLALGTPLAARAEVVISFLHTTPARLDEGTELAISGDMFGGSELESARVLFRTEGESAWSAVPLTPASGFSWRAVIPAARVRPPALEYWVEGIDGLGERHSLFASEGDPAQVPVSSAREAQLLHQAAQSAPRAPDALAAPPSPPTPTAPSAPPGELVIPNARTEPPSEDEPRTLQAQTVLAPPSSAETTQALPPAPSAAQSIPAPGPSGAGRVAKKSRRARPSELSLFAPDQPASLADGNDAPPLESPGISTVLGEDLLKSLGARTVAEALAFVPGLFVTTDALGFNEASARGLRDDAGVLVLYDGQPLNSAVDGRAFLELPTENLERIEVLRGPEASRYGSGALLAVINLVPRRKDGLAAALSGDSSRAGAFDFHGGGQLTHVQIDSDLDVRAADPNGAVIEQDALTSTLRAQGLLGADAPAGRLDDTGLLVNAGGRIYSANSFGGELEIKLRAIHEKRGVHLGEGGVVGGEPTLGGASASAIKRDLLLVDLAWTRSYGSIQIALRGHGGERDEEDATELAPPGIALGGQLYPQGVHVETQWSEGTLGGELGLRFSASPIGLRGEARAGVQRDWLGLYQPASDASLSGAPQGALLVSSLLLAQDAPGLSGRSDLFAQGQLEWRPLRPISLVASARADDFPGAGPADCGGVPCTDSALSARPALSTFSPNAALVVEPGGGAAIKLLAGRAFRAPTFDELSDRPFIPGYLLPDQLHGSQALAPEESDSAALSLEWAGPLADGRGQLRAAGALTDLSHQIVQVADLDHLDAANANQPLRSASLELEGRLESSRRSWEMASFSWTRVRDLGAGESVWLLRDLPQVRAVLAASAPLGPWLDAIAWIEADGARQNNQDTLLAASRPYQIPASALVSATFRSEPLWGRLELALTLRDLLGAATPDDLPRPDLVPGLIPGPGFSASLTARARF